MKYSTLSLHEVVDLLNSGKVSSYEITKECIENIQNTTVLNTLTNFFPQDALRQAKEWDNRRALGESVPVLAGVPITLKDNINLKGFKTTCASKFLENFVSPYSATVAENLINAGAIVLGKNNMDEFAMGGTTEHSAIGAMLNPHDNSCVAGGSSGGSAASVAAHQCYASIGTDTGGSVRQPSAFCGVVGLKPTYGTVSRYGIVAFASSLDQAGPITKTVKDSALIYGIMTSMDKNDFTSTNKNEGINYVENLSSSIKGMRVGLVKEFNTGGNSAAVSSAINETVEFLKKHGAEIVEVSLKNINDALAAYYVVSSAEAASNLARFDGVRYGKRAENYDGLVDMYFKNRTQGFGKEVKRRIMLGNFVLSSGYFDAYYKQAKRVQQLITHQFNQVFKNCDVILTPTAPTQSYKLGEKTSDPLTMYLGDIYTVPVNIAGLPAISVPAKVKRGDLPVGLQFIGAQFSEQKLFNIANYYEQNKGETA